MDNKDFWEQQAKKHKDNVCAVNFDSMEEDCIQDGNLMMK